MSPSCDFEALDALVAGELGPAREQEARAHAAGCARCAHELAWLASERELFAQRACREQAGSATPARAVAPPRKSRLGLYAAAACLLVVGLSPRLERHPESPEAMASALEPSGETSTASLDPQWAIASLESQVGACLLATPRAGLGCGPSPEIPASFGLAGD